MKALHIVGKVVKWYLIADVASLAFIGAASMMHHTKEQDYNITEGLCAGWDDAICKIKDYFKG